MKILIATGIYPPAIGGPAKYAESLVSVWRKQGHVVSVATYGLEHRLPTGIRHFYFLFKIIPQVFVSDMVFALDTFSVGWPTTIVARLFGKKIIMRTGGDFLWEGYVERTSQSVLLRDFYTTTSSMWNLKEKIIFILTRWTLHHVDTLIFSTSWQRDIWMKPYNLEKVKTAIVENYYGEKETSYEPSRKDFIGGARPLHWKNMVMLKKVFSEQEVINTGATYHNDTCPHEQFMGVIAHAYALILVSLGDISPNMILDAIRHDKPFILTTENGLMDRIGSIALTADPRDEQDIKNKVVWLCDKDNYARQVEKIKGFTFTHSWEQIGDEIIEIYKNL